MEPYEVIKRAIPDGMIMAGPMAYNGMWLFSVYRPEPGGDLDTLYVVSGDSVKDISYLQDPDGINKAFNDSLKHGGLTYENYLMHYEGGLMETSNSPYDNYLMHYGVKGMKWGIRKDRNKASQQNNQDVTLEGSEQAKKKLDLKDPRVKKAAVAAAGITAVVAGAYILSKGGVPVNSLKRSTVKKGSEKAKDILEEATDIIYLSKPHKDAGVTRDGLTNTNLAFVTTGQTKDYFDIFDNAGLNEVRERKYFKKLPNGDVAAVFEDLLGRVDAAGRTIPHHVFIPKDQAIGLNSLEDVIDKFGPRLEKEYSDFLDRKRAENT